MDATLPATSPPSDTGAGWKAHVVWYQFKDGELKESGLEMHAFNISGIYKEQQWSFTFFIFL